MSSGPVEQLRPTASTLSASSVASTALMSVPSSILPPWGSSETLAWIGTGRSRRGARLAHAEDRGLELEDVLGGLDDDQVDPALDQARGLLGEAGLQLGERDRAQRRVVGGGKEAGRADRAGDELVLARGRAGDLRRLEVDLVRVVLEAPLGELQARGLERVGLQHVGAGVDHRAVHALDHVRAVDDQGLVAAAGQPVVVLQAEIELLQGGAHAAVVDDRALAGGGDEVSH